MKKMIIIFGGALCVYLAYFSYFSGGANVPNDTKVIAKDKNVNEALATVEKVLRGGQPNELDLKKLDNAVIRLETQSPENGVRTSRGVEGVGSSLQKNIYVLHFDSGGGGEQQLQVMGFQKEILKNQLVLMKTLNTIVNYQLLLGSRTARVENTMRDMILGMKSSASEMQKVRGETSSTGAKVTDIASTTTDMSVELKDMSKNIEEVEGSIQNVDAMMEKMGDKVDGMAFDTKHDMRKMRSDLGDQIRDANTETGSND